MIMHLYSALLCIAVHPKRFTWWRVSPEPPPVYSIHLDDATAASALTTDQLQVERRESHIANQVYALTSYRWRGERVIESIKCMRSPHTINKGQWWEFGQDTGVAPLLFTRSAMGFLMTTESQDLGLTSHSKDGACLQYSVPVAILGC